MATISSTLRLTLDDRVSGPARGIGQALNRLTDRVGNTGRSMIAPLGRVTAGFIGMAAAAVGVSEAYGATVAPARSLQAQLTEIGIKGELSSGQLDVLRKKVQGIAPATNQFTADLLSGIDTMMASGLAADVASGSISIIGKTATATGSTMEDLANTTSALVQNLGVTAGSELQKSLEAMTYAGNAGAFEVRDMAQYFPQLTASARSLGVEGAGGVADLAAALQIARRGAGDASTAANNLSNFLGKLGSKETIDNFAAMGVDVVKELAIVKKKGLSPIEHFIKLIDKTTKGGQVDLLSKLFGDKQVVDFIRPMIADFDDYIEIRQRSADVDGIIDRQYATRMQDAEQRFKKLRVALSERGTEIGAVLLEPLAAAADRVATSLGTLDQRAGVLESLGVRLKGFTSGLGIGDGSIGSLYDELDKLLFGDMATIEADSDRLGKAFLQFKTAGENFRTAVGAFSGAESFGGKMQAIGSGLKSLTDSLSSGALMAIGLGGLAVARLGKGLFGLAFGSAGKLVLIAFGLSALAGAGGEMSVIDWAGVALGVGMLAGPVFKLAGALRRLGQGAKGGAVMKSVVETTSASTKGAKLPVPNSGLFSTADAGQASKAQIAARKAAAAEASKRIGNIKAEQAAANNRAASARMIEGMSKAGRPAVAPALGSFWAQPAGVTKALGMLGVVFDFVNNAGRGVRGFSPEQQEILDGWIAEKKATEGTTSSTPAGTVAGGKEGRVREEPNGMRFAGQPLPKIDDLFAAMRDLAAAMKTPPIPTPAPRSEPVAGAPVVDPSRFGAATDGATQSVTGFAAALAAQTAQMQGSARGALSGPPTPAARPATFAERFDATVAVDDAGAQASLDGLRAKMQGFTTGLAEKARADMAGVTGAVQGEGGAATTAARGVGAAIIAALSIVARPQIDLSSIRSAAAEVNRLATAIRSLPGASVSAGGKGPRLDGARAAGGPVRAGGLYMVGERGRELFSPGRAGYVHSARDTAAMMRPPDSVMPSREALSMSGRSRGYAQPGAPSGTTSAASRPINVTFGNIVVQGGSSSSAEKLRGEFGREASRLVRSHFSDGGV